MVALYSISLSFSDFVYVKKQALWLFLSFGAMLLIVFFGDWRFLKDNKFASFYIFIFSATLLLGALLSTPVRGVRGWINFGLFSIQPAEFIKLALIVVLAKYFSKYHVEIWRLRHIFISAIYFLIPAFLLLFQPDLGSIIILFLIWFFVIIISGIKPKHFLGSLVVMLAILIFAWIYVLAPYQKDRISGFLFPENDPLGAGYQIAQSKISVGSGGLFGRGISKGIQTQYGFLPERHTDFIFASIVEEWGFLGAVIIIFLYFIFFIGLYNVGKRAKNNFSAFFILGYAIMILAQIFINVGGNLGILPITGISLPFLSYGGSNLLVNFLGLGIIINMQKGAVFLDKIKVE